MFFRHTGDKERYLNQGEKYFKDMDWDKQTNFGESEQHVPIGGARTDRRSNWKDGLKANHDCPLLTNKQIFVGHVTMLEIILGNTGTAGNMADKIPVLDSSICQAKELGP